MPRPSFLQRWGVSDGPHQRAPGEAAAGPPTKRDHSHPLETWLLPSEVTDGPQGTPVRLGSKCASISKNRPDFKCVIFLTLRLTPQRTAGQITPTQRLARGPCGGVGSGGGRRRAGRSAPCVLPAWTCSPRGLGAWDFRLPRLPACPSSPPQPAGPHSQPSALLEVMSSLLQRIQLGPHCLFSLSLRGGCREAPQNVCPRSNCWKLSTWTYVTRGAKLERRGGRHCPRRYGWSLNAVLCVLSQMQGEGDTGGAGHAASGAAEAGHDVAEIQAAWLSTWGRGARCHVDPQPSRPQLRCTEESRRTRPRRLGRRLVDRH